MPAFYKIDKERRLVLTTASGVVSLSDVLGHMERLRKDPDFDPTFSQIADFTHITQLDLSPQQLRQLAQRSIFSPSSRRAFIATDDFVYGMGRMYEILRENEGEMGIRVFRTLEEALDWVFTKQTGA